MSASQEMDILAQKLLQPLQIHHPFDLSMDILCEYYDITIHPLTTHSPIAFAIPLKRKQMIFISTHFSPLKRNVVLAEEFAHLYLHAVNELTISPLWTMKLERQAKTLAAFLLIPSTFLSPLLPQTSSINDLASTFSVPEDFMKFRLSL